MSSRGCSSMCAGCNPMYCPAVLDAFTLTPIFTRSSRQASLSLTSKPHLTPKPHPHRRTSGR